MSAWNWTSNAWDPIAEAIVGDTLLDPNDSLYGWHLDALKIRNLEHVQVDPVTGKHHVRFRGVSPDVGLQLATFDDEGVDCLYDRFAEGIGITEAGQECTTGKSVNVFYDPYAGGAAFPMALTNIVTCGAGAALKASPGEEDHWYAERFTPLVYPFTVTEVKYNLLHDIQPGGENEGCRGDEAHEVQLFVVPHGEAPPASPIEVFRFPMAEPTPADDLALAQAVLPLELTLEEGEDLFVAFQMKYEDDDHRLCMSSCYAPAHHVETNHYWSNATTTPYPWVTLASFGPGVDMNPQIIVTGLPNSSS